MRNARTLETKSSPCCKDAVPVAYARSLGEVSGRLLLHNIREHRDNASSTIIYDSQLLHLKIPHVKECRRTYLLFGRIPGIHTEIMDCVVRIPPFATTTRRRICYTSPSFSGPDREEPPKVSNLTLQYVS
jgi:hypothetical protein